MVQKSLTVIFVLIVIFLTAQFIMNTNNIYLHMMMIISSISISFFWIFVSGKLKDNEGKDKNES